MSLIITDLLGSNIIDINSPIIVIKNVSNKYLIPTIVKNIYVVNTSFLYKSLVNRYSFINVFIPVGQIKGSNDKQHLYTVILANKKIIPTTNIYKKIDTNIWYGVMPVKPDAENRTLSVIMSKNQPSLSLPVFPQSFFKNKSDANDISIDTTIYNDLYMSEKYGNFILDVYKFNHNGIKHKMINSTGEISDMYIPKNLTNVRYGKIYFDTQGVISEDLNCISSIDNLNKMTMNQCNANINIQNKDNTNDNNNFQESSRKLILREKDEPWFKDVKVVGPIISDIDDNHKITGMNDNIPTATLHEDVIYAKTESNCIPKNVIGYSRYDADKKCHENIEHFDMDCVNNNIIYFIVLIITCIVFFKLSFYK